jgi:hypothetical protein
MNITPWIIFTCFRYIWLDLYLKYSNIEKFECMEYIYDNIIFVTKFENLYIILESYGCGWNFWVNVFVVNDIDIHWLNIGPFRSLKLLVENPFKKYVFLHF